MRPRLLSTRRSDNSDEPFEALSRGQRRTLTALAVLRSTLVTTALLVMYFTLPFTRLSQARYLTAFVIGFVIIAAVLVLEFRRTLQSRYPRLRAVEAMLTAGSLYLVLFATAHHVVSVVNAGSYSQPMTRLDSLYFAVTTFATVGYGDIAPTSALGRLLTLVQMVSGLVLVGVIAKVLLGIAQEGERLRVAADDGGARTPARAVTAPADPISPNTPEGSPDST